MINMENAAVFDSECFPNAFIMCIEMLNSDVRGTFEISEFRNDTRQLMQWLQWMKSVNAPMISFNGISYDYPMLHTIISNTNTTYTDLYEKNNRIISGNDRFGHIVWDRDRYVTQIDLYRINHFDNIAKTTSLKALEINMRSKTVRESKIPFGTVLTREDIEGEVIPYCQTDVSETKKFAGFCKPAIDFRLGQIDRFGIEVLNYNDGKIGAKTLEQRLGDDVCYDRSSGRKQPRQTIRREIHLGEIIVPYIRFENPEFHRIHQWMLQQTLRPEDLDDPEATIKTKGAFTGVHAEVGGLTFHFGTGGVHASVERQRFYADADYMIRDIDVAALYPSFAIVNQLAPEHLGQAFVAEYKKIPEERALYPKGTYENAGLKLASNVPWGQSNNKYSIFFDSKYAMTVPINCQLLLCMLAEQLVKVPTLQLIQANTDGITYKVRRDMLDQCKAIEEWWQAYTCLVLEDAEYQSMFIRDVNNYIAVDTKGKRKLKGAYWSPDPLNYAESISTASPPCWYKDFNPTIVPRAAVAAMVDGIDPMTFLRCHTDPFDFMCRVRTTRGAKLMWGDEQIQGTTRYYVSNTGRPMSKVNPPPVGYEIGMWKKAPKVTDLEYKRVMAETGGEWSELVCTKNRSKYDNATTSIEAGWLTQECNDMSNFSFDNLNLQWYAQEVNKLII